MIDLRKRSDQKELLDQDDIPFAELQQNLKELNTINRYLGGHAITLDGFKAFLQKPFSQPLTLCEIGSGGGDNLKAIYRYSTRNNIPVNFIGLDIKPECTTFAQRQYPELKARWLTADYLQTAFDFQPDVLFSSLFCHHFTPEQLVTNLQWMQKNARLGFFINDLQRHPLAYYSIKWLTRLFSKSYLVKNDAPLSVARGYTRAEWVSMLEAAGVKNYRIQWKWAFRYLIVCHNTPALSQP